MKTDLPDLPKAPPAPVSDLAWRLMEGDWTALQPLRDALQDAERYDDLRRLNVRLAALCRRHLAAGDTHTPVRMKTTRFALRELAEVLWFDLFAADASIDALAESCRKGDAEVQKREEELKQYQESNPGPHVDSWTAAGAPGPYMTVGEAINAVQEQGDAQ